MTVGRVAHTILYDTADGIMEWIPRPPSHTLAGDERPLAYLKSHVLVYGFADYGYQNYPIVSHIRWSRTYLRTISIL